MRKPYNKSFIFRIGMVITMAIIVIVIFTRLIMDKMDRSSALAQTKADLIRDCALVHTNLLDRRTILTYSCEDGSTYEFYK